MCERIMTERKPRTDEYARTAHTGAERAHHVVVVRPSRSSRCVDYFSLKYATRLLLSWAVMVTWMHAPTVLGVCQFWTNWPPVES